MMLAAALLVAALAAYCYFFLGDFGRLRALAGRRDPAARRRRYRRRIGKALALFGAPALAGLAVLGRPDAPVRMPAEFAGLQAWLGGGAPDRWFLLWLGGGTAIGSLAGTGWAAWRGRRGRAPAMLGDFSTLLPADRTEAWLAAGSAVTAGVTEELYFRLLVPLLVALVTGSAVAGVAAGTLLFGWAHRYQRWAGVAATTLVGLLLAYVYLFTGLLWLAVAVHTAIDLNGLVLRPWAAGMLRRAD